MVKPYDFTHETERVVEALDIKGARMTVECALREAYAAGGQSPSPAWQPIETGDEHELKMWPEFFKALETGEKKHEIRKFDRDFKVGDVLVLREYHPHVDYYTGRVLRRRITHLTQGFLPPDLVAMSIEPLAADPPAAGSAEDQR